MIRVGSAKEQAEVLSIDGREVRVTNPDKPYFTVQTKLSKLELVRTTYRSLPERSRVFAIARCSEALC